MNDVTFEQLVQKIRDDRGLDRQVPGFDSANGNERAKFLFLLEAPGPKAVETGVISFNNPDPTARNLRDQLAAAGIVRSEIVLWNVIPWFLCDGPRIRPAREGDLQDALPYRPSVVQAMRDLRCVILVGGAARRAHFLLSRSTKARSLTCHHPSARVMHASPQAWQENVEIFRFMEATSR